MSVVLWQVGSDEDAVAKAAKETDAMKYREQRAAEERTAYLGLVAEGAVAKSREGNIDNLKGEELDAVLKSLQTQNRELFNARYELLRQKTLAG